MYSTKKIKSDFFILFSTLLIVLPLLIFPFTVSAQGLTEQQIHSILTLLDSFGADERLINDVALALTGRVQPVAPVNTFDRNLTVGSTGDDVRHLQIWLNSNGYTIAESGPGSPGNESNYFGELTRQAVARYQSANGISPTVGYFGEKTRDLINRFALSKQIEVANEIKQGKIMSEKNWECKWNCSNYLVQKDQQNKTNFNNLCHEECRRELDRIDSLLRAEPEIDLESEYKIDFYLKYIDEDKPVVYKLINQDLGNIIGDDEYRGIFARHVYEASNVGYRVVPFPYREENRQIVEVEGLRDLLFNMNAELINCEEESLNQELCQVLEKYDQKDRAYGMLLQCGSKQCVFLQALRTQNYRHCKYISQHSYHDTDDHWIDLCHSLVNP